MRESNLPPLVCNLPIHHDLERKGIESPNAAEQIGSTFTLISGTWRNNEHHHPSIHPHKPQHPTPQLPFFFSSSPFTYTRTHTINDTPYSIPRTLRSTRSIKHRISPFINEKRRGRRNRNSAPLRSSHHLHTIQLPTSNFTYPLNQSTNQLPSLLFHSIPLSHSHSHTNPIQSQATKHLSMPMKQRRR